MSEAPSKVLRFTHIYLENWRNFGKVDIDLQRRVFLVGPNASGKSNFLDAFRFLRDISSVGGGFQEAVRKRGGVSSIRCLAARRYPEVVVRVRIGNEANPSLWEYSLRFNQDKQRRQLVRRETVASNGQMILDRPVEEDEKDEARLSQTYLEQVNVNKDFREVAEFFARVRYLHIVPQLVREPERSVGRKNDPYGGDLVEQIARTDKRTRDARLRRILSALRVAVPQLEELSLYQDERGAWHIRGLYAHWRPPGQWQNEQVFSDGTLRLLGLLWAVLDGTGPLLLEEPELSLHPEVVRHLPQVFARIQRETGRQVLISTHSSDLLHDRGIGTDECLLLDPRSEGTSVRAASSMEGIKLLLEGGSTLADIVIPSTRPEEIEQLLLSLGK